MSKMIPRRRFTASAPWLLGGAWALPGCSPDPAAQRYETVAGQTWRLGSLEGFQGTALGRELVRYATRAPCSHNTQCWKFALDDRNQAITVLPDLSRRCPAVDPMAREPWLRRNSLTVFLP
jgi:hypothetical protein